MIQNNRQPIITDPEVIVQNARAIVGDTPIYALVELITNSDDSYARMEKDGSNPSGLIHVEFVRKYHGSTLKVIDQAEGFDRDQMNKKVGRYGGKSSDREETTSRGYFMRGLKEAMVGVGYGRVRSIRDGLFYECDVDEDAYYDSKDPQQVTAKMKGELGVAETGTEILLKVTRDEIISPQFETLKEQLKKYFSLRKILQDQSRIVELVERFEKGGKKREPVRITYKEPTGTKLFKDKIYINYEGKRIEAGLEIKRADLPLAGKDEAGPYRDNGLLISDGKAIHDITLFKYDNNPDAERLFGELECRYIYELMDRKEQVVSAKRDQLNNRHPFTIALKEATEKALEPIIKEEKSRREKETKEVETRETKERFKKLLSELSDIVKTELGKEGLTGIDNEPEDPEVPENGFAFIPPVTTVLSGKIKTLTLRALVPSVIPSSAEVTIESDSDELIIHTPVVKFDKKPDINGIVSDSVRVEGRQVGSITVITAKFGDLKAECMIQVRSKPKEPPIDDDDRGKQKHTGLFRKIEYSPEIDPRYRVNYDSSTGIIIIATRAPSVKMYLGPYGENQNEKHARVLVAELVVDTVCRILAKRKVETGRETYPQSNILEAINFERARLINEYADRIHKTLAV